jgi:hypothetical protein
MGVPAPAALWSWIEPPAIAAALVSTVGPPAPVSG